MLSKLLSKSTSCSSTESFKKTKKVCISTKSTKSTATSTTPTASTAPTTTAPTTAASATERPRRNDDWQRETAGSASSPFATSSVAEKNENDDEDDEDRDRWDSATAATRKLNFPLRQRRRGQRRVEDEIEFLGERLRCPERYQLETSAVISGYEGRSSLPTDITDICIGEKSFGGAPGGDKAMSASIFARLFGNDQNHRAGVARRIAGSAGLSNLPLSSDLRRHLLDIARADVRQRYDRYLAARLGADILGDSLHPLHRIGLQDVREIVHQPGRRWDLDAL